MGTGSHPADVEFMFGQQPKRTAWSFLASATFDIALLLVFISIGRLSHKAVAVPLSNVLSDHLVWLNEPGPGGGGGGGGNHTPMRPAAVEDARPPVAVAPEPVPTTIPTQALSAAVLELPGVVATPGALNVPQGPGSGGGVGTGVGVGDGPGNGPGLGPGSGGNTGGSVYQPGNNVSAPIPLSQPRPEYTLQAMRARVQGTTRLQCVVQPSGMCTDIAIVRSFDPAYGLDQEAIKSVQKWRFKPGLRFGQPVPVLVTIDVAFTLR